MRNTEANSSEELNCSMRRGRIHSIVTRLEGKPPIEYSQDMAVTRAHQQQRLISRFGRCFPLLSATAASPRRASPIQAWAWACSLVSF